MNHTRLIRICAFLILLCFPFAGARASQPLHVLFIGVDASADGQRGRSDTMMLASIDSDADSIRLASFLRDLYVPIPGHGKNRLNAAYVYGGEALLSRTLQDNFGLRIDRAITVDFSVLRDLVDQLGGVEVDIQPRELDALNSMIRTFNADYGLSGGILESAGLQCLDGRQALCYSRLRKIDSDFQRVNRQQAVLQGMLKRLSQLSRWQLARLALHNLRRAHTDLSFGDIAALAPMLSRFDSLTLEAIRVPFDGSFREETIRGMQVLVPDLAACRRQLHSFLGKDTSCSTVCAGRLSENYRRCGRKAEDMV